MNSGPTCCAACRHAARINPGVGHSRRWALTVQGVDAVDDVVRVPVPTREGLREIARRNARSLRVIQGGQS